MKKNSKLIAIGTYIVILFLIIGVNLLLSRPIIQLKESAVNLQENFENQIGKIEVNDNEQKVIDLYSDYNMEVEEHYTEFGRVFINMIVTLFSIVSLCLVIFGLSRRVNTNKNKGMYNAIILAGITCIIYMIWFIINVSNSFELLF